MNIGLFFILCPPHFWHSTRFFLQTLFNPHNIAYEVEIPSPLDGRINWGLKRLNIYLLLGCCTVTIIVHYFSSGKMCIFGILLFFICNKKNTVILFFILEKSTYFVGKNTNFCRKGSHCLKTLWNVANSRRNKSVFHVLPL